MMEVGRLCVKIAGRDAGMKCVILQVMDKNFVLVDGQTRRKRCNIIHLEPLDQKLDLKEGASHEEVKATFKDIGIELRDTTARQKKDKPKAQRKQPKPPAAKEKPAEEKPEKKAPKAKKPAKEV